MADDQEQKKNIFDQMIDSVSTRDEKVAAEEAKKQALEAQKRAADAAAALAREQAQRAAAEQQALNAQQEATMSTQAAMAAKQAAQVAEARAKEAEAKAAELESQLRQMKNEQIQREFEARRAAQTAAATPQETAGEQGTSAASAPAKPIRKHKVENGETLSHLALKYYGSAVKEKWMIIYEANKEVIGDNPNRVRLGTELIIPYIGD